METIEKASLTSFNIAAHQIEKLKAVFPEVFTEGNKIDFEKLKLTLGENIDTGKERYGMNWPGKADCFKTIQQPSIATLAPDRECSMNFDATENLFIEGDNLEVLKLLQKSYLGKVKMIYIDPPYNTGNEFIYPDNFSESLDTYLEYTGQKDNEGRKYSTNTETDGRFHSKWLNMMYPRLFLAKNLLRQDGLIFISIDDNEIQNLNVLCNEIYGEENFIGCFVWQSKKGGGSDSKTVVVDHEYILCYAKEQVSSGVGKLSINGEQLTEEDDNGPYRRGRELNKWGSNSRREDRPTMWFPIPGPNGEDVYPIRNDGSEGCWRYGKTNMLKFVADNNAEFISRGDGTYIVYEKIRSSDPRNKPFRTWIADSPTTADGSKEVKNVFDGLKLFDFPKPVKLLKHLLGIGTTGDDIVMDFFAGSGSFAHAVMEYNIENEERTLNSISIQLPESTDEKSEAFKAGYKTIAEISKERIRRVSTKLQKELADKKFKEKDTLFGKEEIQPAIDLGLKVFKLQSSNFRIWDASVAKTPEAVQAELYSHINHISPEAEQEAILYELLLKSGFPLTTSIQKLDVEGKTVFSIADGALLVCLEKQLTNELIKAIAALQPQRVICLDEGFGNNDQLKTNAVQIMKSKKVLKFQTV